MRHATMAALAPLALVAGLALLAACGGGSSGGGGAGADPRVRVVTTTNVVADWVENVGGEHVDVFSLVPVGADPHSFQPGARDVARIADAHLVLAVGLGLEGSWLVELLENASQDPSAIVELGELIDPLEFGASHADEIVFLEELEEIVHEVEEGEVDAEEALRQIAAMLAGDGEDDEHREADEDVVEMVLAVIQEAEAGRRGPSAAIEAIEGLVGEAEGEHDDHGHGLYDPHFWFDPLRVKLAVDAIAARLTELDPERGDAYRAGASAYRAELDLLHGWTAEQVVAVPEHRRLLLTSHDSLGYFAALYGFDVVGVILSTTTEATPSATDLAELVHEIEEFGVPAVFGETTVSERLAAAVAEESGAELVRLYSGSLGVRGSGAETYLEMVRTNVARIVEALR